MIKDEDHTKILTFTKKQGFYDNWLLHHIYSLERKKILTRVLATQLFDSSGLT